MIQINAEATSFRQGDSHTQDNAKEANGAGTDAMVTRLPGGVDLRFDGAPQQSIALGPRIETVAVLGSDYPGIGFDVLVEPGDEVAAGQPLLRDRKRSDRLVVAPVSGRVEAVRRGARRSIDTVEIATAGDAVRRFALPSSLDRDSLCALLLASGLWAAVCARPFGHPANLAAVPEALFITAMDTRPHAPDPAVVIGQHAAWFRRGAEALPRLTSGKTYLCHAAGSEIEGGDGVTTAAFSGRHPAGLPSTHIHHLHPVYRASRTVWQIGYQDVIALGHLLETGGIWTDRIVAVSGPAVSSPALLRTRPGASLHQLLTGRLASDATRLVSGSGLDGRVQAFLSRGHLQAFAASHHLGPRTKSGLRHLLHGLSEAGIPPLIPNAAHERAAPVGILPVPFLRALSVGDIDTALRLGALELVEDDMALLTYVDGDKTDYGAMLRAVLDDIEGIA
jgi:Na+-transporting NADH:ubiquinone oxidoreductase subunit A